MFVGGFLIRCTILACAKGPKCRGARLLELCQVALSQRGLLTAEDPAFRVFFVTPRTISRDNHHWPAGG